MHLNEGDHDVRKRAGRVGSVGRQIDAPRFAARKIDGVDDEADIVVSDARPGCIDPWKQLRATQELFEQDQQQERNRFCEFDDMASSSCRA